MATTDALDSIRIIEPLCAVFRRALKAEGLKYTPERARVLDVIASRQGPFEADQIIDQLNRAGRQRASKATVYRTIKLLEDAEIVRRVPVRGEQAIYQLVHGSPPPDLIVRLDTGAVEAIDAPELVKLRDRVCAARGLSPRGHVFVVYATALP